MSIRVAIRDSRSVCYHAICYTTPFRFCATTMAVWGSSHGKQVVSVLQLAGIGYPRKVLRHKLPYLTIWWWIRDQYVYWFFVSHGAFSYRQSLSMPIIGNKFLMSVLTRGSVNVRGRTFKRRRTCGLIMKTVAQLNDNYKHKFSSNYEFMFHLHGYQVRPQYPVHRTSPQYDRQGIYWHYKVRYLCKSPWNRYYWWAVSSFSCPAFRTFAVNSWLMCNVCDKAEVCHVNIEILFIPFNLYIG